MTTHPLILAGAKAVNPFAWDDRKWTKTPATGVRELAKQSSLATTEAVINAIAPGLLTGTNAILPVEATEEMVRAGYEASGHDDDSDPRLGWWANFQTVWPAMVAAYLKKDQT